MKHLFVPAELAIKLKEKGFDEPCLALYASNDSGVMTTGGTVMFNANHAYYKDHAAPLYQQVQNWFLEKHNIDLWAQPFVMDKVNGELYLPDESYSYFVFKDGVFKEDGSDYLEPVDALIAAIEKAIEII